MKVAILTTDNREHYRDYTNPEPHFGTAPEALLQGFAGLPGVEIHVVSCTRQPVRAPEKLADNIWYHNLHVPRLGWTRTLYQGCVRATRNKLREIKPDIVHGQGTEHDNALSAVFSGFPNVVTIHGNIRLIAKLERSKRFSFWWIAAKLEALTLPRANGVVCITRYTEAAVRDLAKRTWLVPNAVDMRFFEVERAKETDQVPILLCVGQVCQRKNQNAFIRALDPLAQKIKFQVLFLGGNWAETRYGNEFLGLVRARPWCRHIGFVGRDELRAHLSRASLLALPSLEDNCPMAVLEAAAAGVPVVAANVGGVPDLIENEKTGLLCDPLDETSMANAIQTVLTNTTLIQDIAGRAKREARERFHPFVIAQRHLDIYREVLDRQIR